ncbi:MAG: hypothetical protein CL424_04275 [Acidimicrobiaceae bacterium]|nr:hypothetical protein [Acidimicrobiaceae bacterium]
MPRSSSITAALAAFSALTALVAAPAVAIGGSTTGDSGAGNAGNGTITVEVLIDDSVDAPIDPTVAASDVARQVAAEGGQVVATAPGVVLVELPDEAAVSRLDRAGSHDEIVVRDPVLVDVRPERLPEAPDELLGWLERFGPTTGGAEGYIGADDWHDAGFTGAGVKIGVIDFFDTRYWNAAEHGALPVANVTARCVALGSDCSSEFFDGVDRGGEQHGVAIVEILRDVAPGAEIYLGQAATTADYQILVDWFASKGVQIISRSLGSRYDGPGDGRGALNDIAAAATARGITWVNSGGNNGERRYYRQPARLTNGWVAFGPTGADTYLDFRGCVQLGGIRWAADWDLPAAQRTDYDAQLIEAPTGSPASGVIVATSTARQRDGARPLELFDSGYCPAPDSTLYLRLRHVVGDTSNDVIEITDYGSGIAEYTQAAYSGSVPIVDSDDLGVVAVAAIDPPFGTSVAAYSSQGPTNDGREAPDLAAVSGFTSAVYGSVFSGTSAAAPVVAAAAALVLDAGITDPGDPLGAYLRNHAIDRGEPGVDQRYGYGQFVLPPPPGSGEIDDRPAVFEPLAVPKRVLDTRPNHAIGPIDLIGELWPGETLELPVVSVAGLPTDGVTAVAVNIVSAGADRPSHVQAFPTGRAALGAFSNLNIDRAGQTRANFAVVPVGDDGSISINSIARGHIVVDLLGWFRAAPNASSAGRFVELTEPKRVMDSRRLAPVRPLVSGEVRTVPTPAGVDIDLVDAWVVTVTATRATDDGWVQAIPTGRRDAIAATSTLNVAAGDTVANAAIVPVGSDGRIALTSFFLDEGSADVIVDVTGYITSDDAPVSGDGKFVALRPGRALDSRRSIGALTDRQAVTVDARPIGVPATASGIVWNATIAGAARPGHVTGWADTATEPSTSLLNWSTPGSTRASSAIVAAGVGRSRFRVEDGPVDATSPLGHLVMDVFGYFT